MADRREEERSLDELSRLNNELTNLQRELSKKNAVLSRLNEEKNTWLGVAAHDLRNPIASIKAHAALLLDGGLEPAQERAALETIGRAAEQMLGLVNDLLDVSAIESGRLDLRAERCALHELVGQRVEFFQLIAGRKRIAIRDALEEAAVELDPGRIEQVIDNLISNAVKYTSPGGAVWISLALAAEEAVLTVRDEGPGLTDEDRRLLFGAFRRLSAQPTGGEKSTGLGLAITHRIVAAHGGRIEVESAPGQGATFRVRLPRVARGLVRPPSEPTPVLAAGAASLLRVLVVDDDEDIRQAVELSLEREEGFEVRTCATADEAVEAVRGFTPDLLLLDVEMPGCDGPTTLGRLRREPAAAATPVVFLTARAELERLAGYRALGALEVLQKPFEVSLLASQLRAAVARRGSAG
jgi:CheY-like chemotaxis protein/nitrogen-specific signal transduction histidine kinase